MIEFLTGAFLFGVALELMAFVFRSFGFSAKWIRIPAPILIGLVLGFFAITGALTFLLGPEHFLLASAYGIGICLSVFSPMAALSFFIANLLLRPWEALPESLVLAALPRLLALITTLSWMLHRLLQRRLTFVANRWVLWLTLLFAWLVFTAMISAGSEVNVGAISKVFFPIYVVCILLVHTAEAQPDIDLLVRGLSWSVAGVIAVAFANTFLMPRPLLGELRLEGIGQSGNANDLAALIVLILPFVWTSFLRNRKNTKPNRKEIFFFLILLAGMILTKSRAGILALGASFIAYFMIVSDSAARLLLRLSIGAPFLLVFLKFALKRDAADLSGSNQSRWNYMQAGIKMLKLNPFFGVGPNNYPVYAHRFFTSFLEPGTHTAHSSWILLLAETGPFGLLLLLLLFFTVAAKAWRMRKTRPEFLMSFVGYGIAMSFLSHTYLLYPYLLIFLTLCAWRVSPKPEVAAL